MLWHVFMIFMIQVVWTERNNRTFDHKAFSAYDLLVSIPNFVILWADTPTLPLKCKVVASILVQNLTLYFMPPPSMACHEPTVEPYVNINVSTFSVDPVWHHHASTPRSSLTLHLNMEFSLRPQYLSQAIMHVHCISPYFKSPEAM